MFLSFLCFCSSLAEVIIYYFNGNPGNPNPGRQSCTPGTPAINHLLDAVVAHSMRTGRLDGGNDERRMPGIRILEYHRNTRIPEEKAYNIILILIPGNNMHELIISNNNNTTWCTSS